MTTEDEILKVAREAAISLLGRRDIGQALVMQGPSFLALKAAEAGARALAAHLASGAEPVAWLYERGYPAYYDKGETTVWQNEVAVSRPVEGIVSRPVEGLWCRNIRALYTSPPAPAVKVNALIWTDHPDGGRKAVAAGLGLYRVHRNGKSWYLNQGHMGDVGGELSAQADYEQRIRSALAEDAGAPRCADPSDDSHMVSRLEPTPAPASDDLAEPPYRIRVAQDDRGFWSCAAAISGSQEYVRSDLVVAKDATIASLRADVERQHAETEHFARLACVDLGANPPVLWKDRAEAAEAERDALKDEVARKDALLKRTLHPLDVLETKGWLDKSELRRDIRAALAPIPAKEG